MHLGNLKNPDWSAISIQMEKDQEKIILESSKVLFINMAYT